MTNPAAHYDAHGNNRVEHYAAARRPAPDTVRVPCPGWCVTQHDVLAGEDDWLHTGEPLILSDCVSARLCMSIHPATGEEDGPYVLLGTSELTLDEAARLGASLLGLANPA